MRTKAVIKGHPIHQMMIPFPIAFFIGALIFDITALLMNEPTFRITAAYLSIAGVITGIAAALPGFIDYLLSIPPNSTGKKRAAKHMIVNLSAVLLFLISFLLRLPVESEPGIYILILETAGAGFLTAGGWMGGTLVNRNFIGPDHRYANAGKWSEVQISAEAGTEIKAAEADELKTDQMKLIRVNDKRIVLAKTEDGFAAFDDSCTHRGGSLAGGVMICGTVQCLWHGSQFDVKTGEVKAGPAEKKISTYYTEVRDNFVYIRL